MKYRLNPGITIRRKKRKVFLYNRETDQFFELNPTALAILELLQQCDSMAKIIEELSERYPSQNATELERDVEELKSVLIGRGILVITEQNDCQAQSE